MVLREKGILSHTRSLGRRLRTTRSLETTRTKQLVQNTLELTHGETERTGTVQVIERTNWLRKNLGRSRASSAMLVTSSVTMLLSARNGITREIRRTDTRPGFNQLSELNQ